MWSCSYVWIVRTRRVLRVIPVNNKGWREAWIHGESSWDWDASVTSSQEYSKQKKSGHRNFGLQLWKNFGHLNIELWHKYCPWPSALRDRSAQVLVYMLCLVDGHWWGRSLPQCKYLVSLDDTTTGRYYLTAVLLMVSFLLERDLKYISLHHVTARTWVNSTSDPLKLPI